MSSFSNAGRKPGRRSFDSSSSYGSRDGGSSYGSSSSRGRFRGGSRRSKREVKKFDPSMFMRKVEEQTATPSYIPKHHFADFLIEAQLKENIIERGYKVPTPIQDQAIPLLLQGKDLVASANTGTGKTAAFLIPLINNVLIKKINHVLIIAPTRELAEQIQKELDLFKNRMGLSSALCIGGANMGNQIRKIKRNPAFVIGTPGRLRDLERKMIIDFSIYNAIVLDEVDTMLDMGFIHDIKHIISGLPAKRHSLFFSATVPKKLKDVMDTFLNNPITISVKTRQSAENVNQDVIHVTAQNKIEILHEMLIKPEFKKVIIFLRTKRAADKLSRTLRERGFSVAAIHGDKTQAQRSKSLAQFKGNQVKILLATDVVARGIDIDDVSHVLNFDLPQTHDDYIHRIGRTGRADKVGQAITFVEDGGTGYNDDAN